MTVVCGLCGRHFLRITNTHLEYEHSTTPRRYLDMFPDAEMCSEDSSIRQVESALESYQNPDRKQRQHEMMVELWKDPHYRRVTSREVSRGKKGIMPKALAEAIRERPNQTEMQLKRFLDRGFPGLFTYNETLVGTKCPDFVSLEEYRLIIEIFGTYWHDPNYFPDKPSEGELISYYGELGYKCIVVWVNGYEDIIAEWPKIANKIKEVVKDANLLGIDGKTTELPSRCLGGTPGSVWY